MANIFDKGASITHDGSVADDFMQAVAGSYPEIDNIFEVYQGIKSQMKLIEFLNGGTALKVGDGCVPIDPTTTSTFEQKLLIVKNALFEGAQCAQELEGTLYEDELKSGALKNDIVGSRFMNEYAIPKLLALVNKEFMEVTSFGDTASPDSVLQIADGFLKILQEATIAAEEDGALVGRGSVIVDLNQTVGTRAIDYLEILYTGSASANATPTPLVLKNLRPKDKIFLVTGSIFDNYRKTLQDAGLANGIIQNTTDGIEKLSYNGVEVLPIRGWDSVIASKLSDVDPHRIIYTSRKNLVLNLDSKSDLENLEAQYVFKDDMTYVRGRLKVGTACKWGALTQISY